MTGTQKALYANDLTLYKHAINQQKKDKDKIYSLHKPFTECITKGKEHKICEFGNKVGLIKGGKIILAIQVFLGNPFDGHTIEPLLHQMETNKLTAPKNLCTTKTAKGNRKSWE